jgi:predicted nucleotidyltransferase
MLPDWIELCKLLNAHGVEYLLVGGQAVIAHGYPRLTKDIDLWVRPTAANGLCVMQALLAFGVPSGAVTPEQFEDPRTLLMLGREPFRVDILTDIPAVTFDEAWSSRITVTLDGVPLQVIGKADLIKNKRAVGRLQDLADADELEKLDHLTGD